MEDNVFLVRKLLVNHQRCALKQVKDLIQLASDIFHQHYVDTKKLLDQSENACIEEIQSSMQKVYDKLKELEKIETSS